VSGARLHAESAAARTRSPLSIYLRTSFDVPDASRGNRLRQVQYAPVADIPPANSAQIRAKAENFLGGAFLAREMPSVPVYAKASSNGPRAIMIGGSCPCLSGFVCSALSHSPVRVSSASGCCARPGPEPSQCTSRCRRGPGEIENVVITGLSGAGLASTSRRMGTLIRGRCWCPRPRSRIIDVGQSLQTLVPGLYIAQKNGPFDYVDVSLQGSRTDDVLWDRGGVRINNRLYSGTTRSTTHSPRA